MLGHEQNKLVCDQGGVDTTSEETWSKWTGMKFDWDGNFTSLWAEFLKEMEYF